MRSNLVAKDRAGTCPECGLPLDAWNTDGGDMILCRNPTCDFEIEDPERATGPDVEVRGNDWSVEVKLTGEHYEERDDPKWWHYLLAFFRLSDDAVCRCSADAGPYDYHDYTDTILREPWHFVKMQCERCGKRFYI